MNTNFIKKATAALIMGFLFLGISHAQDKISISKVLRDTLNKSGIQAAITTYKNLRINYPGKYDFSAGKLSSLGFKLVNEKRVQDAIGILRLNLTYFPDHYATNGFLGYAYMDLYFAGDSASIDSVYKYLDRSDQLNPRWGFAKWCKNKLFTVDHYTMKVYRIPMRDSVKLYTKVYIPKKTAERFPILFHRRPYGIPPYGEDKMSTGPIYGPSEKFLKEGYIFAEQDVRGTYMSEGEFMHIRPYIEHKKDSKDIDESSDAYDAIDWLLKNIPNNNGKVGVWGTSYMGFYTVMALLDAHPAVVAAAPAAPAADFYIGDDVRRNGALHYMHVINFFNTEGVVRDSPTTQRPSPFIKEPPDDWCRFLFEAGPLSNINTLYFKNKNPFWNQILEHESYDNFWKERSYIPYLKNTHVPVLNIGGWFDAEDLYGTLTTYRTIETTNPASMNTLLIGPWYHGQWSDKAGEYLGDIKLNSGSAAAYFREEIELPFFNFYLKGKGNLNLPEAMVYETGTNVWKRYDCWPPKQSIEKRLYFHENKKVSFDKPSVKVQESFSEYASDPANPVPMQGDIVNAWDYRFMHADQRFASVRQDVLTFTSEPFTCDLTIIGTITADLYVSTSTTDADFIVKVIDVYPDSSSEVSPDTSVKMGGYQMLVRNNILRGKFRNSFEKPEAFVPNEVANLKFELMDINHTFKKGHKIMVQVQSSCFPLYDINPQQYENIGLAKAEDFIKAKIHLYHSGKYPSCLRFNIVQ